MSENRYYFVKEHPVRIINKCRCHCKGTLMSFLLGICIIFMILNWIPALLTIPFPLTVADMYSNLPGADPGLIKSLPQRYVVIMLYTLVFTGVFRLGEALYTLTYIRSKRVEMRSVIEAFGLYFKTLRLFLLQVLIISFWTMLFIVPGIVAALNFSQSFYILADDPSKSVTQILNESRLMMLGNRIAYIKLVFYYAPYLLAAYLLSSAADSIFRSMLTSEGAAMALSLAASIPFFLAAGYMELGRCVFYELIINKGFAYFRYSGQDAFREYEQYTDGRA